MRKFSKQTPKGIDQFLFLDAGEIPGMIEKHQRRMSFADSSSWYGDAMPEFKRKATTGDNSMVEASEKFLASLEDQVPMSRGWKNVEDVVGAIPNIPAFLAGHPQHMRRRQRAARDNAPLTIYMDLTSSAAINSNKLTKRGVVLLALVRMLVEHRAVELWVGISKGKCGCSGTVAWKIDTTPLDLSRSSYHIGATAMSRVFGYGVDDDMHQTGGGWPFGSFESHRTAKARLQEAMGAGDMLYIPPIYLTDPLIDDPVGWLKGKMKEYVGGGEE